MYNGNVTDLKIIAGFGFRLAKMGIFWMSIKDWKRRAGLE
jgi:hypothetical protein